MKTSLLIIAMLLSGCAITQSGNVADIDVDCEAYGVRPVEQNTGRFAGTYTMQKHTLGGLLDACYGRKDIPRQFWIAGCVKGDGEYVIHLDMVADNCTMNHELAHLQCGRKHTRELNINIIEGRRTCP